ncbi:hypothetical protein PYCC9005_005850 [Savitreella phatthalungensis]
MILLLHLLASGVAGGGVREDGAKLWCGKAYEPGFPALDPGKRFPIPRSLPQHTLKQRLTCTPTYSVYYPHIDTHVDIQVTHALTPIDLDAASAQPGLPATLLENSAASVEVTVAVGGSDVRMVGLPLFGSSRSRIALAGVSRGEVEVRCSATVVLGGQPVATTHRQATLHYLPPAHNTPLARIDARTASTIVYNPRVRKTGHQAIFPWGFYGDGGRLRASLADTVGRLGSNVVHAIPDVGEGDFDGSFGVDFVERVVRPLMDGEFAGAEDAWIMPDFRWHYTNLTSLTAQAATLLARTDNAAPILTWYTADEPDGNTDHPHAAPDAAHTLHNHIDRHLRRPVSIVLNCRDYGFSEYVAGAEIVLVDPYPIGVDMSFSRRWGTPCNETLGACGCDGCKGTIVDMYTRVSEARAKLTLLPGRQAAVWAVAQAFDGLDEKHWDRLPTPTDVAAMSVAAIVAGATGQLFWMLPAASPQVEDKTAELAEAVKSVAHVITAGIRVHDGDAEIFDGVRNIDWRVDGRENELGIVKASWLAGDGSCLVVAAVQLAENSAGDDFQVRLPDVAGRDRPILNIAYPALGFDKCKLVRDGNSHRLQCTGLMYEDAVIAFVTWDELPQSTAQVVFAGP